MLLAHAAILITNQHLLFIPAAFATLSLFLYFANFCTMRNFGVLTLYAL
jgi:hypothetical protein